MAEVPFDQLDEALLTDLAAPWPADRFTLMPDANTSVPRAHRGVASFLRAAEPLIAELV